MRKLSGLLCSALLVGAICSPSVLATGDQHYFASSVSSIDDIEKEKEKIFEKHHEKYKKELLALQKKFGKEDISKFTDDEKKELRKLKKKHLDNARDDVDSYMNSVGFTKVGDGSEVSIESAPSDLAVNDYLYYNSTTRQYNFDGYWDFSVWDFLVDTIDIASVRMNNDTYPVVKSYAYSYDQSGTQTGYDNNGSPSTGSKVTKRFENKNGVVYNIQDSTQSTSGGPIYKTDHGRLSMYFTKGTGSNKVFLDFEHNYKSYDWQTTASINGITLNGIGLSVTYSKVNNSYLRTSTGETIQ